MRDFPPSGKPRGRGRPALGCGGETVKTTLRFPRSLLDRIEVISGEGRVSAFIREAVEVALANAEKRQPSKSTTEEA